MGFIDRLKIAGREVVKGNFGNALSLTINPAHYRQLGGDFGTSGAMWFFQSDGHDILFEYGNAGSSLKAYQACPPLSAIINRKAQAFSDGQTWILNAQGKAKGKEATGEVATRIRNLMERPNFRLSWREFEAQNYVYQQLAGFCVVLPIKPVGFDNTYATAMWNIPPWMLEIKPKRNANFLLAKSLKDMLESVTVVYDDARTPLSLDDIFIFTDLSSASCTPAGLPESRIRSLTQPINNLMAIYESMGVIIDKRGPSWFVSSNQSDESGNIALQPGEKKQVQEDFAQYGLRRNQMRAIITSANINVQTVGFSTKDLMLIEMSQDAIMRLCDGYGYPYPLIANDRTNSLGGNNTDPFRKVLYEGAILPESKSTYGQWEAFFSTSKYSLRLEKDYSHVAALQEDKVQQALARFNRNRAALIEFQNNLLKLNEWREMNGEDPIEGENGDKYYYELVGMGIKFGSSGGANSQNVDSNNNPDAAGGSGSDNNQSQNQN